jgi:hypothetical protein
MSWTQGQLLNSPQGRYLRFLRRGLVHLAIQEWAHKDQTLHSLTFPCLLLVRASGKSAQTRTPEHKNTRTHTHTLAHTQLNP